MGPRGVKTLEILGALRLCAEGNWGSGVQRRRGIGGLRRRGAPMSNRPDVSTSQRSNFATLRTPKRVQRLDVSACPRLGCPTAKRPEAPTSPTSSKSPTLPTSPKSPTSPSLQLLDDPTSATSSTSQLLNCWTSRKSVFSMSRRIGALTPQRLNATTARGPLIPAVATCQRVSVANRPKYQCLDFLTAQRPSVSTSRRLSAS